MLNKIKNIKLSKSKYIYTVIAGLIIIALGTTFAWWRWSSDINALVNGKVCAPEIVFVGGTTINGTDLLPVRKKEEGLSKDINVNLNNTCDNDTAVLNLNLKPDVLPEGLADSSFKWALYKVTTEEVQGVPTENLTYVNDGNFNGKRQYVNDNDLISIATDLIVTENISTYRLFIWIDGTMDNASTMGDNFFKFSIYGTGKDAIYREYVMKNPGMTQSTTYFINSSISKDTIESVDIVSFSNLPEGVIYVEDVSSNSDDSIKLYYLENPETNLKKVYLASSSGLIKMNTSMDYMFAGLTHVESLDLSRLDTSNVTSMVGVFYNSPSLTSINMSSWVTSRVTSMSLMFYGCNKLTSLDLSSFSSTLSPNMTAMFQNCGQLNKVIFGNIKTGNMSLMFYNCKNLQELDLSTFDTSSTTSMLNMFRGCTVLETLDLSTFNTEKVTNMTEMFYDCQNLKYIDLSGFNTSIVTSMNNMFGCCYSLTELDLSSFTAEKLTNITEMFASFWDTHSPMMKFTKIDISGLDFTGITSYANTFRKVSTDVEIIVKDCTQYNKFVELFGNSYTNLHTVNNDNCTV